MADGGEGGIRTPGTVSPAPVMKKREIKIGQVMPGTRLMVLARAPSDAHGNQRALVRCGYCGTEKEMRVTAMTHDAYTDCNLKRRKPVRSCGCKAREAHREYWENRARGIRRLIQQKIYRGNVRDGKSFQTLAKQYKMPVQLVTTILRLYAQRHRPPMTKAQAARYYERARAAYLTRYGEGDRASFLRLQGERAGAERAPEPHEATADDSWVDLTAPDEAGFDQDAADQAWADQLAEEAERESRAKRKRARG
jgi:hypothetical protein